MSPEQQTIEKGRMLEEFEAAKREHAAIRSRASGFAGAFHHIGAAFRENTSLGNCGLENSIAQIPNKEELEALVADAARTESTMQRMRGLLYQMGIKIE